MTMSSPTLKDTERFNGLSEEELKDKILPDHLKEDLDIVIVGINPSLASAHVGHHYAGPGNHFWTCLSQAGLVPMPVNCYNDENMLQYGIGFTNVCTRPTKGAAELSRKEMKAGAAIMLEKMRKYKPKIAVFNGKGIYEAYVGHKNFSMGKQPQTLEGTDTIVFVMPSSSARCAQLPRAEDKLPFFVALRKLRDYIRGEILELDDSEIIFADYTEFRVTQPDPKSLRKAERRRKRKAEAAAAAAAAAMSNASGIDGSTATVSGQSLLVDPSTGILSLPNGSVDLKNKSKSSKSAKRKGPGDGTLELGSLQPTATQIQQNVSLAAEAHLQQKQQQQWQQLQHQQAILFQQQQFQQQQQFAQPVSQPNNLSQPQQMIVSGGQLISATPMVTLSMAGGTAIPIQHGAQAAITGCYGTPQFQFSATGGVPQPFFISPQHTGSTATGGQALFQWPTAQTNATLQFQQQPQQPQPTASWHGVSATGVTIYNPQQAQQQQVGSAVQSPAGGAASTSAGQQQQQQQQAQQLLVAQHLAGLQGTQQHQQLLLSSHHPVGFQPTGAATGTYPQQIYFAQAPAGTSSTGGTSYQLLPVGCPPSNFTSLLLSDQQQQQQHAQPQLTQCSTGQIQQTQASSALQMQTAQQQQLQHQLQQQHQLQVQQHLQQAQAAQHAAYIQPQNPATNMLATEASSGPTGANTSGTPATQFITLAPGAPLKVMTVGPNGQLIQAAGLPQFMPSAAAANPVGMAMQSAVAQQQQQSIAIQPHRSVTMSQPQTQTNGRAVPTFFTPGTPVSSGQSIPLVHAASGGDDFLSNPNGGTTLGISGDEKLVYTAL